MKRCAIYTRKSSDEGLDQHFNSLDAQREACEAYVLSQTGEGWTALPARYDDGGYSGGSMERPALRQLLEDIGRGLIDIVVVYKIDRLTRSLPDFARIVERFDARDVSFISVTQAFNTTSSMGRLTLNVLLSFAQFEREVTGERIRDKIAASKAKGMWMGGLSPLGYDLPASNTRVLQVNEAEAETVRHIFRRYLALGSVHRLLEELERDGVRSKARVTRKGDQIGDQPFSRGALYHLLQNRTYVGEIVHKDQCHPGQHVGIVGKELFDAVQASLAGDRKARQQRARSEHPFSGKLFDAAGNKLVRAHSRGARGRSYSYYVPLHVQLGGRASADTHRFATGRVDAALALALARLDLAEDQRPEMLVRAELAPDSIALHVAARGAPKVRAATRPGEWVDEPHGKSQHVRWTIPAVLKPRGGRARVEPVAVEGSKRDPVLIAGLRAAHRLVSSDRAGAPTPKEMPESRYSVRLMRLAFLSPSIQQMILDGRQPGTLRLEDLVRGNIPLCWTEQEQLIRAFARTPLITCSGNQIA